MRKWLHTYFDVSKSEFNGLLVLFALILLVAILPLTFDWLNAGDLAMKDQPQIKELEWMEQVRKSQLAAKSRFNRVKPMVKPFEFDPNDLDVAGWQKLGLSFKQAQAVINYVNKGGKFYKTEDVKSMYTINAALYARLEPFIKIKGEKLKEARPIYPKYPSKHLQVFEVNTADTLQLQEIRGVGPAFARRIAKYRDRLGGFYKLEQLLEVYGLDSLKYAEIKGQLRINMPALHKININTADFDDLKSHPYLNYKQVNAIIQYRKQHGNYTSFADLKKVIILPPETVDNLAPYLSF